MSVLVLYLIGLGAGILLGAVLIEWSDARERRRRAGWDAEWRALDAARDVTGRDVSARYPSDGAR